MITPRQAIIDAYAEARDKMPDASADAIVEHLSSRFCIAPETVSEVIGEDALNES